MTTAYILKDYDFIDYFKFKFKNHIPLILTEDNYRDVIRTIITVDLFDTNLNYLIIDHDFLTKKKNLKKSLIFENNLNDNHILVLNEKPSIEFMNKQQSIFDYKELDFNLSFLLKEFINFNNISINKDALELLKFNLDDNYSLICRELEKLILLDKTISTDDVNTFSYKNITATIFEYCDAKLDKNEVFASRYYQDLLEASYTHVSILILYYKHLIYIYNVYLLSKEYNTQSIVSFLFSNTYRVNLTKKKLNKINIYELEKEILQLNKNDYLLKTGKNIYN